MFRSCTFLLAASLMLPLTAAGQTRKAAPSRSPQRKAPAATTKAPAPTPAPEPIKQVPPDLRIVTTYTTGESRTTSTVLMKGPRTRVTMGDTLASIQQCDAAQTVQLNTQARTYLATPFDTTDGASAAAAAISDPKRKGGEVIYTTTITDTGETQTLFGFPARHLKTVVAKDFTTNACDRKPARVETDGWYIELPSTVSCLAAPRARVVAQPDPQHPDCVDEIKYEDAGTPVGYPVKYTTVSTLGDEPPVTTAMEVSELERVEVDASALDVPADYVAVRTVAQLTADHRPGEAGLKKPGSVRVGLLPLANKTTASIQTDALNEALLESFGETELDVVRLAGQTPSEVEADAKAKAVDLVLSSTVAEVKAPRGGIMGRVSGSSAEAFNAKVEYSLVAPGQSKPMRTGSERSGASTFAGAMNIARRVAQFAPPLMMAKYGYMNAYGSMLTQGGPSAAMRQTPDPVMNMAFSLLDHAAKPSASEQYATEQGAVASALEKVVAGISADLAKKPK